MEWVTTIASATMLLFFGTLAYWIHRGTYGGGPVIYPPLVIAATISMLASVLFTVVAVRSWMDRREHR
jgi:apolipoprotein N-acyltransferase